MRPAAYDVSDDAMAAIRARLPFERVELAALNLGLEPLRRDLDRRALLLASVVDPPPPRRRPAAPWWVWLVAPAIVAGFVVGVAVWAVARR